MRSRSSLLVVGSATAAPKAIRGTVVAKRAHGRTVVLATGRKGAAVTVHVAHRHSRLGDRLSVVGKRLRDGTIKASSVRVLSHVKKARIHGMVVKRLAHALRVASGHSVLTIHTTGRALASHHDGPERGEIGEFEIEFEHGDLVEHGFTPATPSGTVEIEGHLLSVSPLVVSLEGLPIEITVPSSMTLPPADGRPGGRAGRADRRRQHVHAGVDPVRERQRGPGRGKVEAKGPVTNSTTLADHDRRRRRDDHLRRSGRSDAAGDRPARSSRRAASRSTASSRSPGCRSRTATAETAVDGAATTTAAATEPSWRRGGPTSAGSPLRRVARVVAYVRRGSPSTTPCGSP